MQHAHARNAVRSLAKNGRAPGALSPASRYRRLHFGLRELSPEMSRAMTEIDPQHEVAFVARPAGDNGIVADARYVLRADSADAEFAIAVADDWRGAGPGRAGFAPTVPS